MGLGKWIGGALGFMAMGPLGAFAGFAIGSLFDTAKKEEENFKTKPETSEDEDYVIQGRRNSFRFSLMVLASYIIKADGRVMHSEMEFVRQFLRINFGEVAVADGEQILLNLFEQRKRMERTDMNGYKRAISECGSQIAANLTVEERLQLLSFLVKIAQSDGNVCNAEIEALKEVAVWIGLSARDVESMLNLRGNTLDEAYKVLEVSPDASDDEVRAAYRRLALKHHPDRVATLGEDVRRAAEEKFQQINNAKERIYKARGMK